MSGLTIEFWPDTAAIRRDLLLYGNAYVYRGQRLDPATVRLDPAAPIIDRVGLYREALTGAGGGGLNPAAFQIAPAP